MSLESPPDKFQGWVDAISRPPSAILSLARLYQLHAQRAQKSLEQAIGSLETQIHQTLGASLPRPKFLEETRRSFAAPRTEAARMNEFEGD